MRKANQDFVSQIGILAETFGRMVAFAISQLEGVDMSEIRFRATAQAL